MAKRLVLCCDGTWNTPDQDHPTNVTKLALAVADAGGRKTQLAYYQPGVGTSRWERIRGGVFGMGLSQDVTEVYSFLVTHYDPGDEVFLFGYSRGAYTARSVAGLIHNVGILRREHASQLGPAYNLYRSRAIKPRATESQLFRRSFSHADRQIRFLGVWDTVGALGIPLGANPIAGLINRRWRFHDVKLSTSVDAAYHAVAIDEKRRPFQPSLWEENPRPKEQVLEQVWFVGCHGDVGGGGADTGLSDLALGWMAQKASDCGLVFDEGAFVSAGPGLVAEVDRERRFVPNPLGAIHESSRGTARLMGRVQRKIGEKTKGNELIASTVMQRRAAAADYRPQRLEKYLDENPGSVTSVR